MARDAFIFDAERPDAVRAADREAARLDNCIAVISIDPRQLHDETTAVHIAEQSRAHRDTESCRLLWMRVLEVTMDDLSYQDRYDDAPHLKRHERARARRIHEFPPDVFVESGWFDDVCGFAGVDPRVLREALGRAA